MENRLKTVGFSSRIKFWLSELNKQNIISIQSLEQNERKSDLYQILETKTNSVHENIALRQLLQVDQTTLSKEVLKRVVQSRANCHAMNGILLTKEMGDLVQERSPLMCFPDSYNIVTKPKSDILIKVFSSKFEEKYFKQALRVLGIGLCEAKRMPIHGLIPWLRLNSAGVNEKECYVSTIKYQSISGISVSYSITQLQLSREAEDGLRSIIEACKVDNNVYKACVHFFQLFGSHIAIGPLHYGGLVVFTCSSVNFEEKERNSIVKLQESILMSTSDINDIDIDPNKYKHMCSEKILTDTCLNTEILLGLKTAASMEQWGKECIAETDCWNLTDRGKQLVAIWELLALDHHYEEFGRVINVLKESWEKMTGLEATNDVIFSINSQKVATNRMKPSPTLQKKSSSCMHSVVANGKNVPTSGACDSDFPLTCSDLQVTNCYEPQKSELDINIPDNVSKELIHLLGLNNCYNNKIQLKEAIAINSDLAILSNSKGCSNLHELPFLVLYKLMSYDVKCRSNLMSPVVLLDGDNDDDGDNSDDDDEEEEEEEEEEQNKKEEDYSKAEIFEKIKKINQINAMDCLHALLLCCDDLLRQDLFSRLAKCQLSIPFLMPDPVKKTLILPIWAMRSIIKEWTPHGKQPQSHSIVTYPMPIVSFIMLGKHKKMAISKSRIMNILISGSEKSPFFHYNCSGGQHPRVFSKGLVDMSWYLPSGKSSDTFNDAKAFLNLHGDAHQYPLQTEILTQISSLCFVVITKKLNTQDQALLKKINDSPCSLQILSGVQNKLNVPKKVFAKSKIISLINNNDTEISEALQKSIVEKVKEDKSLEEITTSLNNRCVIVDENSEALKLALESIQVIKENVMKYNGDSKALKSTMLPLQGPDLWQEWASKNKELYRQTNRGNVDILLYSEQIEGEKEKIRKKQLRLYNHSPSDVVTSFLDVLLQSGDECGTKQQRDYFLQHLNLFFKDHYRHYMNSKEQKYLQLRAELDEVSSESLKEEKKKEFEVVQKEILETTLGIEHLFREIGQIYEAACADESHEKYCAELSSMMAELVIDGYPLEVMDGDVMHVPLKWIKAVLTDVNRKLNDPKMFVLSVLGIQSSGKSTMLNAVFGLQFKVSAGQCTRGAFMQLIELNCNKEPDSGCNYILIVDTEGLHAPKEEKIMDYKHDNELATFVIGLANTTLINIMGEVSGNMDDILQISVHSFLRMNKDKNKRRSCQFVRQNTSISTKSSASHKLFTQNLDKFTKYAAKAENSSGKYECFNDVIRYNDMKDTHNFPALWKGNPPMAPVNDEYSEKAQFLKHHIISSISKSSDGFQAFSSFISHFSSIWVSLLKEDFLFSFKNTYHVIAHEKLVKKYMDCKYKFSVYIRDWILVASNEIRGCNLDNVIKTVQSKQRELQTFIASKHKEFKEIMDSFFKGEYQDSIKDWKSVFDTKLQDLADTLLTEGNNHCNELLEYRKKISEFDKKKNTIRVTIANEVKKHIEEKKRMFDRSLQEKKIELNELKILFNRDLFADNKLEKYKYSGINEKSIAKICQLKKKRGGTLYKLDLDNILINFLSVDDVHIILKLSPQSDTVLEKEFECIWNGIMDTIDYTPPRISEKVAKIVQEEVIEHVKNMGHQSLLIKKFNETPFEEWKQKSKPKLKSSFFQVLKGYMSGKHEFDHEVRINNILREAKTEVSKISMRNCNFSATMVQELLKKVDDQITSVSSKGDNDFVSMEIKLELYLIVCSNSIQHFKDMALKFEHEQDPKKYIEENEKLRFLLRYKNEYKQFEAEESIAYHICVTFESPIKKQIRKKLSKIVDEMREKEPYLKDKGKLKVKILLDLMCQDDFKQAIIYVKDIQTCIAEHLKIYTIKFGDGISGTTGLTRLQNIVKNLSRNLIERINDIIQEICGVSKTLKEVSDKLINDKCLHSIIEYNDRNIVGIDLRKDVNLTNLKNKISAQLHQLEIKIERSFSSLKCEEAMKDWSKQPHEMLSDIIGCTAACPFCGEQCDHLDPDHYKTRKLPHATKIHRFDCLAGWRDKDSQVMVTGFCSQLVGSDRSFYKLNGELQPYKKYYEVYGDWSIENTPTSKNAIYWKRFIMKHKKELAEEYNAKPAVIPAHWRHEYTYYQVKKDLESIYEQLA